MIYLLDDMQLAVLKRVESRLYDEMTRLTADDRRDLANAMNAVRHQVETLGALPEIEVVKASAMTAQPKPRAPYGETGPDQTA